MKFGSIVTGLGLIVKAQEFHKDAAAKYAALFNESFAKTSKEISLSYTPLQEFYQRMAQRHLCQFFYFQQQEVRYCELVDTATLETEPGEDLTNDRLIRE